jgi:hypothetical protein
LFNSTHSSVVVFLVDYELVGTGPTNETMSVFIFFREFAGGKLTSLDC